MTMRIEQIPPDDAYQFLVAHKSLKQVVFQRRYDLSIGAFDGEKLVAVGSIARKQGHIELAGIFVDEAFRRRGIASAIIAELLRIADGAKVRAYARPLTVRVLEKHGFVSLRCLSNGTQYMEKSQ